MEKSTLAFLSAIMLLLFVGCTNQPQENEPTTSPALSETESSTKSETQQEIGRDNYAVIWKWATDDTELVNNNSAQVSKELSDLWKKDVVENAYYDAEPKGDKLDHFPNIVFFLKAKDMAKARSILDGLTVVTKKIASYELRPVGNLWLDRKTEIINQRGLTKSFAAVWTTEKSLFQGKDADDLLKKQNDVILSLWNNGIVENVYFDTDGSYMANDKTDFVFFVNANTEAEAKKICDSLPFAQEKIATYKMYQSGVFWMGKYENE